MLIMVHKMDIISIEHINNNYVEQYVKNQYRLQNVRQSKMFIEQTDGIKT